MAAESHVRVLKPRSAPPGYGAAPLDSMPALLAADTDLSVIQGEDAHAFVDNPMFDRLRSNLSGSIGQLQALLYTTCTRLPERSHAPKRNRTGVRTSRSLPGSSQLCPAW